MSLYLKDPDGIVSYAIDWGSAYLGDLAIAASAWGVSPDEEGGVQILSTSHDFGRTAASVGGGRAGRVYRLANRVTLSDGSVDERSLVVRVEQR